MTVVNAGYIGADGLSGNGAIALDAGGCVTNQIGGVIHGFYHGIIALGAVTVVNAGRITSAFDAVDSEAGFANRMIVDPGAKFIGTVDAGNTIGASAVSTLELAGGASGLAGTITGFAQGDTIEITGITVTGSNYAGGVLTLDQASGSATLDLTGSFATSDYRVTNVTGGAEVTLACFRAGTRIRTPRGEIEVQDLAVGDRVDTVLGDGPPPIIWIGHRHVDCTRHPRPKQVWPVRISAGAFSPHQPRRDLYLSPDHAIHIGEVLIPIKHLINGTSIAQVPVNKVTYYHIELSRHDVLLAEGMPAESYLDTGDRSNLENGDGMMRLFPDFSTRATTVCALWEAMGCAPLVVHGPELDAVRKRVSVRAPALGWPAQAMRALG